MVSISNKEDLDALILAVETTQPDIVIIHQECHALINLIYRCNSLQDHPAIKVIMISLENNMMEVYSKQKILVKQASDLITVIENEPYPQFISFEDTSNWPMEGNHSSTIAGGETNHLKNRIQSSSNGHHV